MDDLYWPQFPSSTPLERDHKSALIDRGGNVKRVASAVGESSISIAFVHQVLSE